MQYAFSLITIGLIFSISAQAQSNSDLDDQFKEWIDTVAFQISGTSKNASHDDLAPVEQMLGDARIADLSESLYSAAELVAQDIQIDS